MDIGIGWILIAAGLVYWVSIHPEKLGEWVGLLAKPFTPEPAATPVAAAAVPPPPPVAAPAKLIPIREWEVASAYAHLEVDADWKVSVGIYGSGEARPVLRAVSAEKVAEVTSLCGKARFELATVRGWDGDMGALMARVNALAEQAIADLAVGVVDLASTPVELAPAPAQKTETAPAAPVAKAPQGPTTGKVILAEKVVSESAPNGVFTVKVEQLDGKVKTFRGVELRKVFMAKGIRVGSNVSVEALGKEPVVVTKPDGSQENAMRNTFRVELEGEAHE